MSHLTVQENTFIAMFKGSGGTYPVEASNENAKKKAHQIANEKIQLGQSKKIASTL